MAPAAGTIINGLSIHNLPHAGSGSPVNNQKREISNNPIAAPIIIRLIKGCCACAVELFAFVIILVY